MKIGIFLQDLTPESGGGFTFAETVIAGLAEAKLPDSFVVFHYGSAGRLASELDGRLHGRVVFRSLGGRFARFFKRGWYVLFAGALQRLVTRLRHSFKFRLPYPSSSSLDAAARKEKIDLMWFPTPTSEAVECPSVLTVWDLEHRAQPYFPEVSAEGEWDIREKYFSRALRRAAYVITGTEVGKREIREFYGVSPDRIRLLPHPTPRFALEATSFTKHPISEKLGVRGEYVLYPAQFWAHKNHVALLEAIAVLKSRGTALELALVGSDKGNRAYVAAHAKRVGIEDQVHFLGFVSREDLIALYRNAVAMVYPSLCGPENLPPLEAMALGCPVVAAEIAGSREQLGEAALRVRATDSAAIAEAVERVRTDGELRARLVEAGLKRSIRYTDREFLEDLARIFDEFRKIRVNWA